MRLQTLIPVIAMLVAGCVTTGDSLRLRANSPAIDDAFRRLSIALTLDGYPLERTDPVARVVETGWRTFSDSVRASAGAPVPTVVAARIRGTLVPRGRMYDVFLTIIVREATASGTVERPVEIHEPLAARWRGVLKGLFVEELGDED